MTVAARAGAWAVDRLWLGLIQPSDEAWRAGSTALASAPLARPSDEPEKHNLAVRIQALAEVGRTLTGSAKPPAPANLPRRLALYGEIVATCAGCHGVKAK